MQTDSSNTEQAKNQGSSTLWRLIKVLMMQYLSHKTTIIINTSIALIFVLFCVTNGVIVLVQPADEKLFSSEYSQICKAVQNCTIAFNLGKNITESVAIYYVIENSNHNTKNYYQAKNENQLAGNAITLSEATQCQPFQTNAKMGVTLSWGGYILNPNNVASPCGLQAKSHFTDTFQVSTTTANATIRRTGFVTKFARQPDSAKNQWIDPTDEPFQIWMHNSIGLQLKKMYGVIDGGLSQGNYTITIDNVYGISTTVKKRIDIFINRPFSQNCFAVAMLQIISGVCLFTVTIIHYYCQKKSSSVVSSQK